MRVGSGGASSGLTDSATTVGSLSCPVRARGALLGTYLRYSLCAPIVFYIFSNLFFDVISLSTYKKIRVDF